MDNGGTPITWIVVALAGITMLKNVADGVLNWLGKRDQLRNDTKITLLEAESRESKVKADAASVLVEEIRIELDQCRAQHKESEEDRKTLREECKTLREEVNELKRRVSNFSNIEKFK